MQRTVAALGRIDGCFANAGIGGNKGPFDVITAEVWRKTMRVNLDGAFFTFAQLKQTTQLPSELLPTHRLPGPNEAAKANKQIPQFEA